MFIFSYFYILILLVGAFVLSLVLLCVEAATVELFVHLYISGIFEIDTSALRLAGPRHTPHDVPLAKHVPIRWTSQFKMMERLLALKKAVSEYFRQQPHCPRKLSSHE